MGRQVNLCSPLHCLLVLVGCSSGACDPFLSQWFPLCLCRMDDIQLCKEISRLKKELQQLIALPGTALQGSGELLPAAALSRSVSIQHKKLLKGSRPRVLQRRCRCRQGVSLKERGCLKQERRKTTSPLRRALVWSRRRTEEDGR